nr:hypothetical protein [Tanacetum cinerariifolium]
MMNVIPLDHVDDVPVLEPNQHDDVLVILEPVLVDEDEDPEEDEFKEEEDPQEEEDDMESEPEDAIEVENPIEHEDEIVPASVCEVGESFTALFLREDSDGLLPGLMRKDINSLLVGLLLFQEDCNEVRFSVKQGTTAMEKLVEKLGNAKDKAECKKLNKELEEASFSNTFFRIIMPPKSAPLTQATIRRMIKENVDATIAAEQARHTNVRNDARRSRPARGQDVGPTTRECTFVGFMKCNPTAFCEGKKETVNQMPWTEMKQLMIFKFCPSEEIQRMKHELWNLKVKEYNIVAYTQRFNELALMCPRMVKPKRVKVDAYIQGLTDNIKDEVTSSRPANLNEACHKCGKVGHKIRYCKEKNVCTGANALPIPTCYDCIEQGFDRSFVDTRFSSMLDIDSVKIEASYEVELADGSGVHVDLAKIKAIKSWAAPTTPTELDSVQFLGHVIDHSGVHVDLAKIKAIKSWAAPTTPTE